MLAALFCIGQWSFSAAVVLNEADTLAAEAPAKNVDSIGTEYFEPAKVPVTARSQFLGVSAQPVQHRAVTGAPWSDKIHDRQDPYVPELPGAATADDWCSQPEIHDPACMANPPAMELDAEIDAVMRHMMCRLKKGSCGGAPETSRGRSNSTSPVASAQTAATVPSAITAAPPPRKQQSGRAEGKRDRSDGSQTGPSERETLRQAPKVESVVHDKVAEKSAETLTGLVDQMVDITDDLDKKGELDAELGRATKEMIQTGKDAASLIKTMSRASDHEANEGLEVLVHEAEELDHSVFKFETGVHPHGYKWWRYRWEYAFVEATTLNALVFIAMLLYLLLHWSSASLMKLTPNFSSSMPVGSSVAMLYCKVSQRGSHELSILAILTFLIWGLEECGLFVYLAAANPVKAGMETVHGQTQMHWPTTDQQLTYTLRTVNMHFFVAMLLYLLLMYHVSQGAICILEQFMKHESPDFYNRFMQKGGESEDFAGKTEEVCQKADVMAGLFKNKGFVGKVLTSDTTMRIVVGHFHADADYSALKNCVAEELQTHLGSEHYTALPQLPIYPYIAMKLQRSLQDMIVIDWRVWLMVELVLVIQAFIHYYFHQGVMEILPLSIAVACAILICQFVWTRRMASYVVDERNHFGKDQLTADNSFANWMLWMQQLNLFFLCFSAARLLLSSFFWTDYFALSCAMLGVFLCLYFVFVFIGSLIVPMFIIMLSVQRVTDEDVHDMKMILQVHVDSERSRRKLSEMSPTSSEARKRELRKSATSLVVV